MNKKIGLLQVDGTLPNLALMKICRYYELNGDLVEWYMGSLWDALYDKIYASQIFDFSPTPQLPNNAIIGGTGIDLLNKLPDDIDICYPSYSLYPNFHYHIGFSMRGCRFNCEFCNVPRKEGKPRHISHIDDLLLNPNGGNRLILLDNDFFGSPFWEVDLKRIIDLKLQVCFSQGINIRVITPKQAELLAKCNYRNLKFRKKYLSFAWDRYKDKDLIISGIEVCNNAGIPNNHMQFFVLIGFDSSPQQDMERVLFFKKLGIRCFAMPYDKSDLYQKNFARWVNYRPAFNSCSWEEYKYNPEKLVC